VHKAPCSISNSLYYYYIRLHISIQFHLLGDVNALELLLFFFASASFSYYPVLYWKIESKCIQPFPAFLSTFIITIQFFHPSLSKASFGKGKKEEKALREREGEKRHNFNPYFLLSLNTLHQSPARPSQ